MGVAGQGDLAAEFLGIELFTLLEREGIGRQKGRRRQAIDSRRGRYE